MTEVPKLAVERPLAGVRIVDAVAGSLAPLTRYLAELGARVDRIVPATGTLEDIAANAGKTVTAPNDAGIAHLAGSAHAVVADAGQPLDLAALRAARPNLVTMTVSDFGTGNAFSGWQATGPILHAMSGELSRSGIKGRPPLLPPGDLAYQCAATQAAFVLVTALYRTLRTGEGDHLDFSALDGAVQALDPGYGVHGSATLGKPAHLLSRDRPPAGFQYPILNCADGQVRICLLAKRQWQGMFRWMGEPEAFASPDFDNTTVRYQSAELLPAIAAFVANQTRAELEVEAQRHGVPLSALRTFGECVASKHMAARDAFIDMPGPNGGSVTLPNGVISVEGVRMGPASIDVPEPWPGIVMVAPGGAVAGLRVLDLGVIVVGAEQGRLLADNGADVVKVESRGNPDGLRQSYLSFGLSISFAAGHRNKRSLGIDLRNPAGRTLFLSLAAKADVILSNFKPGTLETLGLDTGTIEAINPGTVMVDSSAFGPTGPWSQRMGYGPLVRAATGLALAWRYPEDNQGFSDSVTVYPDHAAGRIGAIAAVALLIRRLRTGRGGSASIAQAEVMMAHFGADVARQGQNAAAPAECPWGVYRALGDDEWCVVTVRDNRDWMALCGVVDFGSLASAATPGARLMAHELIRAILEQWFAGRIVDDAVAELQLAGVPAARMLRVADLPTHPYYVERGLFRVEEHPYLTEDIVAERWHAKGTTAGELSARPAPLMGEHSMEVIADWLSAEPQTLAALVACAALEPLDDDTFSAALANRGQK